ncbi:MAG: TIGR03905 family TSCPD domain-containing protein [Roseburia sp.]
MNRTILERIEIMAFSYTYKTKGTCSTKIELELEGNIVHNVKFTGGCNGNLQAIPKLVEGLTVEQVVEKIGGISCNGRPTSCGDQLAHACKEAYEASLQA